MRLLRLLIGLWVLTNASALEVDLIQLLRQLQSVVQPQRALRRVEELYAIERWFTFSKFHEASRYLAREARRAGFKDVEVRGAPADGVTQVGYWTLPLAWEVSEARLEVIEPPTPEEFRVLCDYRKVPQSLCMWSGPTPPGGLVAEVVEVSDDKGSLTSPGLRGKVAFTRRNPSPIKWELARSGVVGVISGYTENPELVDGHHWVNAWGDKGWGFTRGDTPLFCFSLAPKQATWLQRQLATGQKVKVRALVDSRYFKGTYPYLTAVLPGVPGREEVLALAHTAEPGAQDNATGVAAMFEAAQALQELITTGQLPKPRRSIRVLAMPEIYGSLHYLETHRERIRRTVAAICLDTPAARYELPGTEYTFYLNPHASASYVDALVLEIARRYFGSLDPPRRFFERPYRMGTDNYLSDPTIGVPTVWPYSGSGTNTHHNSEDTPDDVDPRSLRDLSIVTAAFLYTVAAASDADAFWLTRLALDRATGELRTRAHDATQAINKAARPDELVQRWADAADQLQYRYERHRQAILSVRRVAPRYDPAMELANLEAVFEGERRRVRAAAERHARQHGWSLPDQAGAVQVAELPDEARRLVVRRKRIGSIPLDDLPVPQRQGWPSAAWDTRLATALYWCDGRRTLAEVIRLTRLELGPDTFDYLGYFRFLASHGYVELIVLPGGKTASATR